MTRPLALHGFTPTLLDIQKQDARGCTAVGRSLRCGTAFGTALRASRLQVQRVHGPEK
jgi:hypothetical protein